MTQKEPTLADDVALLGTILKTPDADASDEGTAALLRHDPLGTLDDCYRAGDELASYRQAPLGHSLIAMQEYTRRKDAVLTERGDTKFSNTLEDYMRIVTSYGFEVALELPFTSRRSGQDETYFILVQPELGLVLCFDTYGGDKVNGGKVYYNWKPADMDNYWDCTSSGGFHNYDEDPVWAGDHDCREALIFNMERLRKRGTLLPKWEANPFLWFLHYDDTFNPVYEAARDEWLKTDRSTPSPCQQDFPEGEYDYDAINRERIAMAPKLQAVIRPYKGGLE